MVFVGCEGMGEFFGRGVGLEADIGHAAGCDGVLEFGGTDAADDEAPVYGELERGFDEPQKRKNTRSKLLPHSG